VIDVKSKGYGWESVILQKILSVFYKNRVSLQIAFQSMDKDSSGKIDVNEFKNGLRALNELMDQQLSDLQIAELHRV
jgi:Ca2+-binding EF-hand superfamily protein